MKNIFTDFVLKQVVLFVTIIVILILNVGVMLFRYECNCETRSRDCSVHMAIPFFIIFVLQLWTDKTLRYTFARIESCCHVVYHMIKAALVGLLWVAFVLIEGQWYACCVSNTLCNYYRTDERRNSRVSFSCFLYVSLFFCILLWSSSISVFSAHSIWTEAENSCGCNDFCRVQL